MKRTRQSRASAASSPNASPAASPALTAQPTPTPSRRSTRSSTVNEPTVATPAPTPAKSTRNTRRTTTAPIPEPLPTKIKEEEVEEEKEEEDVEMVADEDEKEEQQEEDADDDEQEEDEEAEEEAEEEEEEEKAPAKSKKQPATKSQPQYEDDSDIEDMDEGEDDDDDDDDEEDDDEDEDGVKDEPMDESKSSADAEKFGSALTSLLSKPLPKSVLEGKQAPVLLQDRTLAARHAIPNAARAAKKLAVERKLAKKYMYNKDHIPQPQKDNVEKKLMQNATRGVVALFNAVHKQHRELKRAAEEASEQIAEKKQKVDVSKSGFLQLLKTESENVQTKTSNSLPTPATMGVKLKKEPVSSGPTTAAAAAAPASTWKVLDENYLMGGKMTDWDKAVHSSEEEEDEDE